MSFRALLRSSFQGVSQTLVVSVALFGLFNSTIWMPALEASSSRAVGSTSLEGSAATPTPSNSPNPMPATFVVGTAPLPEPKGAAVPNGDVSLVKTHSGSANKSTDVPRPSLQAAAHELSAQRPVFIENKGQFDPRVRFQVLSGGKTLWLTDNGVVFDFVKVDPVAKASSPDSARPFPDLAHAGKPTDQKIKRHVICQDFVSANHDVVIETKGAQEGTYNYFSGSDPAKWQTKVRAYSEVIYHNVWNGVDLRLYANDSNLEQEFIVKPGADTNQIRVAYRGIEGLEIAKDRSLVIKTAAGQMHESAPRVFQEKDGQNVPVQGKFRLLSDTSYTFKVAEHDPKLALVIDPTVLYSTYLGGSGNGINIPDEDVGTGVAVDASGNAYITGYTLSPDFPVTPGALQANNATNGYAGFITKSL